ncbi:serine/threonine protein kinase [Nocardia alba]|uniref:Serine/threonine protein kinase n=2 Tax=Nocardia alba TaxID=225051 RepID=A0A4R1G9R3_9NOCA|nr:serine/threonine-protein kinase [Nocardia alba]TCK00892.1 serine/threonine protein kinase [Nocardia alba]
MKPLGSQDPEQLGRYRLLAVIGQGGMGQVLLGQGQDGRLVAVKQIHRQFTGNPEFRARFRREVMASQQVTGAYTAGVVDHDADSETPWLASEYIAGPGLQDMIGEFGRLNLNGLKLLATGLAMALLEIHRTGLVHRDLKPSNILLTNDGPRVIDFGIARALEDDVNLTATGAVIGSPAYMSPEQAECRQLTPASDVFAVGAVLAMAATGASPFDAASTPQVLYNVLYGSPDVTGIPEPIRALVDACLAKDPSARPTPEQLLDAASRIDVEPVWPVRIRRRIADCQAEAGRWADGTAAAAASIVSEAPKPRWARLAPVAAAVSAVVLASIAFWGVGVEGNAVAMDDPPLALTHEESRRLDLCALLDPSVLGELGTATSEVRPSSFGGCTIEYRDQAGRKMSFSLNTGEGVADVRDDNLPMGSTINWMPVLGRYKESASCDRMVVTQSGLPMVLKMGASTFPPAGDLCPQSERALAAVVRRLSVNPPLRTYPQGSLQSLDPCTLIDLRTVRASLGDLVRSATPHGCALNSATGLFVVDIGEGIRPDSLPGRKARPTRTIGGHTVYLDGSGPTYCTFIHLVMPTKDDQAEQLRASYYPNSWNADGVCETAAALFEPVLEKLPPS